jgi:hypothetical protein
VNPNESPGGPGPARQGSGRWTEFGEGDRVLVSGSNFPTHPRTNQVVDLFQPVTSSAPPAAANIDQPAAPINGYNQDGESLSAPASRSGYASAARRWVSRGAELVPGTQGAVIALAASAALVLVVAGMTMFTTSSSTESAVAGPTPGQLSAPVTAATSDEHLVTVSPIDVPVGFAGQIPAKAYSTDSPAVPAHQQPLPTAHRGLPARPTPPPAPDNRPVLPPPSTVPTQDAGYWTVPTRSHTGETESPTTDTEPCDCDGTKREIPNHGDRPSMADRQREVQAQRAGYRSTSAAHEESKASEHGKQGRQTARPDAKAESVRSPDDRQTRSGRGTRPTTVR